MNKFTHVGRLLGVTLGAAAGLAGVGAMAALRRPLPKTKGAVQVPGLQGRVQVLRDRWGVPHIYAATNRDLFMAQGYVHAQDRLWQMEMHRRLGHGQLAELFGPIALTSDRFIRVLGFSRVARAEVETLDDDTREALQSYVDGVNAFLDSARGNLPVEFLLLRHRPRRWEIPDVLVWSKIMALNLSENWTGEVLRARLVAALGAERAGQLEPQYPDDQPLSVPEGAHYTVALAEEALRLASGAAAFTGPSGMGQGSNGWVVGGSRSATGKPLLSNDPHLGITMPSLWYEVHLEGGDYAVTGASLPGIPSIVIGHNARIAWGVTNAMTDVQDLYIERFHPDDPLRYEWKGEWQQAELVREEIIVKGQKEPVVEEVRVTRHGPVVSPLVPEGSDLLSGSSSEYTVSKPTTDNRQPTTGLALRWTALEPSRINRSALMLNKARDWDEFRAALADWNVPAQNFVYADVDGHYGYALGGDIPVRAQDDGRLPMPGWNGEHEWVGFIPAAEMPHSLDPEEGFAATANNRIVGPRYPYHLSSEWLNGYRVLRIRELLEATPRHDTQSFVRIQHDRRSLPGLEFVALAPRLPAETPLQTAARDALAHWNGDLTPECVGGTIYASLRYHLQRCTLSELGDPREFVVGLGTFASLPGAFYLGRSLPGILRRIREGDDGWLGEGRTWDGVLAEAWQLALDELCEQLGPNVSEWQYGRVHSLTLRHVLGSAPALAKIFNRGPWPTGGDLDTVCMGNQVRDTTAGPVYIAPSYRQICDTSDWDKSCSILPTGQSGQPGSRHYADMARPWRIGGSHPMLWSRAAVEAETVATLMLQSE